jgi:hypothetical protein
VVVDSLAFGRLVHEHLAAGGPHRVHLFLFFGLAVCCLVFGELGEFLFF